MTDQPNNDATFSSSPPPAPQFAAVTSDDKTWSALGHAGQIVIGFIAPLIVLLAKGNESAFLKDQAQEALNFSITVMIASAISAVLMFVLIGLILLPIVAIYAFVMCIIAALQSSKGVAYRYPLTLRLVK